MFADKLCEKDSKVRHLLTGARMVRVHTDVVDLVMSMINRDEGKIAKIAKYTCWPDHDTWLEWEAHTPDGHLNYGFLFHGDDGDSGLSGTGVFFIGQSGHPEPITIPVRYDLWNYTLHAYDINSAAQAKLATLAMNDPRRSWLPSGPSMVDPILLAAQCNPLLNVIKPVLFGMLAFMNTPKLIKTTPADVDRFNARRIKRGKYPYHPHHEVRLNIDKHTVQITQGQGDGPERCLHFVRAHLRFLVHPRYKNVSVVLVPPHHRGNPELGIMNTSYVVNREDSK